MSNKLELQLGRAEAEREVVKRADVSAEPGDVGASGVFSVRVVVMLSLLTALACGVSCSKNASPAKPGLSKPSSARVVSDPKVEPKKDLSEQLIDDCDSKINSLESGYLGFKEFFKPGVSSVKNVQLNNLILRTFELLEKNKSNPDKNYRRFLKKNPQARNNVSFLKKDYAGIFFTFTAPKYMGNGDIARFYDPVRVLELLSDFDVGNIIDFITLMHELIHVTQDDDVRGSLKTEEEYRKSSNEASREEILSREVPARACEVEVANNLSSGMLKEAFKDLRGEPIGNRDAILSCANNFMLRFGLTEKYRNRVEATALLAFVYYSNSDLKSENGIPRAFVEFVGDVVLGGN